MAGFYIFLGFRLSGELFEFMENFNSELGIVIILKILIFFAVVIAVDISITILFETPWNLELVEEIIEDLLEKPYHRPYTLRDYQANQKKSVITTKLEK